MILLALPKVFADFQGAFRGKPLKARFGTVVPTYYENKKARHCRAFLCVLSVGASAPNPNTRNFSRKVSWNFKSFAKTKWYIRCEVFADF